MGPVSCWISLPVCNGSQVLRELSRGQLFFVKMKKKFNAFTKISVLISWRTEGEDKIKVSELLVNHQSKDAHHCSASIVKLN